MKSVHPSVEMDIRRVVVFVVVDVFSHSIRIVLLAVSLPTQNPCPKKTEVWILFLLLFNNPRAQDTAAEPPCIDRDISELHGR